MGFLKIMIFSMFLALILFISSATCNANDTTCTYSASTPIYTVLTGGVSGLIAALTNFFQGPNALQNIAAGALAVIAAYYTVYPNPWVIFFGPAVFLFTWSLTPSQIFNASNIGVTDPNGALVIGLAASIIQILSTVLLLSWFKGQESIW